MKKEAFPFRFHHPEADYLKFNFLLSAPIKPIVTTALVKVKAFSTSFVDFRTV